MSNKIIKRNERKGFTLIELSLSLVFIAVLSLAVVLIITNSISAYHRGLVLNQINTVGMEIVDDMRATIQNTIVSPPKSSCEKMFLGGGSPNEQDNVKDCKESGGAELVSAKKVKESFWIDKRNKGTPSLAARNVPINGVFCTGNYSFIWNSGYFFDGESSLSEDGQNEYLTLTYNYNDPNGSASNRRTITYPSGDQKPIRLLKVKDPDRAVCAAFKKMSAGNNINIATSASTPNDQTSYNNVTEPPIDLLSENSNLALYDLYSPVPATNAMNNNMFYSVSFILGTLQGGANVTASGDFCTTPEGLGVNGAIENFDYCAINKFNFAAEAIGGGE